MRIGRNLNELAAEITRQQTTRKDFTAPTKLVRMNPAPEVNDTQLVLDGYGHVFNINDLGHRQIGDYTGVPAKYYDRMRTTAPQLLASNVNHWLSASEENRMVRTLDGRVRAFLSDKYRPLENVDLAEVVLPIILEKELTVVSCEITERRLYIKAVDKKVVREVEGRRVVDGSTVDVDHISPSVIISNSEVGMGALGIDMGAFTHECSNMARFKEKSLRKYHVGGRHEITANLEQALTDKTRKLSDAAVWAQVGDVMRHGLSLEGFEAMVDQMRMLRGIKIGTDTVKVVQIVANKFELQEGERKSVLTHLIQGGDLTGYGIFNAITRTAEDAANYDRANELEGVGGQVLELAPADWKQIAEAA